MGEDDKWDEEKKNSCAKRFAGAPQGTCNRLVQKWGDKNGFLPPKMPAGY